MSVWPMLLDMSRDDCKRLLRRLELEAYGSIVTAVRAQGALSSEKRKLLQDLCAVLNISMERHKAEIRRVANDERLATVAELMAGPNSAIDWAIEGRRLIPLLPRLVPQTAFTALANNVANIAAAENASLPPPSQTVKTKDSANDQVSSQIEPSIPEASKTPQQSASPVPSNHMMLPPGTSIRLKKDGEEESKGKKRSRSSEGRPNSPKLPPVKLSIPPHQKVPLKSSYPVISTPIKITPLRTTAVTHSPSTQKVIIVSSSATLGSSTSSSILQRSLSGPLMKPPAPFTGVGQPLRGSPSLTTNTTTHTSTIPSASSVATIVTISASANTSSNVTTSASTKVPLAGPSTATYVGGASGAPRIRPMALQLPVKARPRTSSIIIPTTSGVTAPQRAILQTVRPILQPKHDSMHVKTMGISSTPKILPKPSYAPASVSPMYVMSTSSPTPITMITRAIPANISPRVNPTSAPTAPVIHSLPTIGTKHPYKTIQKLKVASSSPGVRQGSGKTNVIVVQKGTTSGYTRGVTLAHGVKQEIGKKMTLNKVTASHGPSASTHPLKRPVANVQLAAKTLPGNTKQGSSIILLDLGKETFSKNTVLADILQASGIPLDDSADHSIEAPVDQGSCTTHDMAVVDEQIVEKPEDEVSIGATNVKGKGHLGTSTMVKDTAIQTGTLVQPIEAEELRTITIEEAVQLLGHSDSPETRLLLRQAGIEVRDHVPEGSLTAEEQGCIPQVVHEEDVVSADTDVMEVLGELDPQTGVYSVHAAIAAGISADTAAGENAQMSAPIDIFSTALASADINLNNFQYMDDGADLAGSTQEYSTFTEATLEQTNLESASDQQQMQLDDNNEENYEEFMQPDLESNAVTVEPSNIDTTEMYIEDFTSQKM